MNTIWIVLAWCGLLLVVYLNNAAYPLKKVWLSLKKNKGHELKIFGISSFLLLTIIMGWMQSGLDDALHYVATFFGQTYEQAFFPVGKLNFIIVLIALIMQYAVNSAYKRWVKPHEDPATKGV
jgi:hypothetical protein